ncbi:MAG TPA: DoxX family protein [Verrucomicrobiae bacterium]|jgi:putative oxidoreductase
MKTLLNRLFAPGDNTCAVNAALLVFRLWLGLTMLLNHGWTKFSGFATIKEKFPGVLGMSPEASLGLAVFAELVCSALLVIGLVTRFAALNLAITMGVAFMVAHGHALKGEHSGELPYVYLAGFVMLLLAGPGKFSADACVFGKPATPVSK